MSTLVTSNISDGTTSVGTGYVVNGSAKAWVTFQATGTVTVLDGLNVSSLTDDGVGITGVVFTSAFSDSNRCPNLNTEDSNTIVVYSQFATTDTNTASKVVCRTYSGAYDDCEKNYLSVHGDLA